MHKHELLNCSQRGRLRLWLVSYIIYLLFISLFSMRHGVEGVTWKSLCNSSGEKSWQSKLRSCRGKGGRGWIGRGMCRVRRVCYWAVRLRSGIHENKENQVSLGRIKLKDALWDTGLEIGHWCPARCQRRGSKDMSAFLCSWWDN